MRERVCKNCGGRQYEVVGQNMVKCQFCGTLYVDEHASKEEETLTVMAYEKLKAFRFDEAVDEFDKILAQFPLSFEAYYGKTLAKHKIVLYSRRPASTKRPRFFGSKICKIAEDPDFLAAVENAPIEIAKTYKDTARRVDRVADRYQAIAGTKKYDVVLCAMDYVKEKPNEKILEAINKLQEKGFSTYFVQGLEKETEEETYNALKTSKVFVLYANKATGYNESEVKNLFDRYRYFISQKTKTATSFIIAFDNGVVMKNLPKEFSSIKSIVDLSSVGISDDLVLKVRNESKKAAVEVAKIEKVSVDEAKTVKKEKVEVETVSATELGNYKVENIELSEANKIKWVFISIKNGDFQSAKEIAEKELKNDPNNAELLFATLLCDYKVHTAGEFFLDISNLKEKERIDKILKYASKDFAEMIVDNWSNLIISLDSVEYYNAFLLYLAQYNTPNRCKLVGAAENKALESLDKSLIEKVIKCFQNDDVDRFVNFYFLLAQASGDDDYYKKVLDIDQGHEQSNIAMLLKHFKDDGDKLGFRNKEIVEDTLKYLDKEKRAQLIAAIVNLILPVCYKDMEKTQEQLDFYLAYVEDDLKLAEILKDVALYFQQMRFYTAAEKYIAIAISKKKSDAELYWILIQIKCHCNSEAKLFKTNVKISHMPEWESLLACADESQTEKYGAIISKANLYSGEKIGVVEEWFDQKILAEKLNDFIIRNNNILIEMTKDEGKNVLRGANYFKKQLAPFENYLEKLKTKLTLEEFQEVAKKIATRLSLLDLGLDMSINVTKLEGREEALKSAKVEKLSAKEVKKQKTPKIPSLEVGAELDDHKKFTKRYLFGFLEVFPICFTTLLLALIIGIPKQVYMYFNQYFVISLVCFGALLSVVHLAFYLIRKQRIHKNWKVANIFLMIFGFMNVALLCIGFYLMPTVISINNGKEFNRLLHNAPYAELRLEKNIDMKGIKWKPCDFEGTLHGNNKIIKNLYIKSANNVSLFKTNSGTIENLLGVEYTTQALKNVSSFGGIAVKNTGKIRNCHVYAENTIVVTTNKDFVFGGIAAKLKGGIISGCEVRLNVSITSNAAALDFGGIVGKALNVSGAVLIKNQSYISLNVNQKNTTLSNIGGLIGLLDGSDGEKFDFSRNKSEVHFNLGGVASEMYVGGLVGYGSNGSLNNYTLGTIAIYSTVSKGAVGGLYGSYIDSDVGASINHSYSSVIITSDNALKVGSLVGRLGGVIKYCFTTTDSGVTGEKFALGDDSIFVGGNVKVYSSSYGFDSKIWNFDSGLPVLRFE